MCRLLFQVNFGPTTQTPDSAPVIPHSHTRLNSSHVDPLSHTEKMEVEDKLLNIGLLVLLTLVVIKLISLILNPRSPTRLPPVIATWPVFGGLIRFLKGPVVMLREEYPKLGSVFTLNLFNKKITFFIGPEVSVHFFKASESNLSQQEVYKYIVPTFGPGVIYDVDYSVRQEQFRFFTESLRVNKLKGYVGQMLIEAQVLLGLKLFIVLCWYTLFYLSHERK